MLPQVVLATAVVVALPVALVWWLRAAGVVTSSSLCVLLAIVLSIVVSAAASACWKRCRGSERVVFSELLLWGWIRRLRLERCLANVSAMLQSRADGQQASGELLRALASALDAQDPYTEGHSRRVARHATMVARELRLSHEEVERVRTAAAMHDVGKLRVPRALLSKPGRLTTEEFEAVQRHATEGAAMVAALGDEELTAIVRHHHERFDGTGYPSGLGGTDIPLGARIVAVADTFDAITSIRTYRPAAPHKEALDHLVQAAGSQLDPAAVRAFLRYYAGRKGSVLWAGLTVAPQRLFAWMHGSARSAGNVAFSEVSSTIGSIVAVGLAAVGTAAVVAVGGAAAHRPAGVSVAQSAAAVAGTGASGGGRGPLGPGPSGPTTHGGTLAVGRTASLRSALSYVALRRSGAALGAGWHQPAPHASANAPAPAGGSPSAPQSGQAGGPSSRRRGGTSGGPGSAPKDTAAPGGSSAPAVAPVTQPAPVLASAPPAATSGAPAAPVSGSGTSGSGTGPGGGTGSAPGPTNPPPVAVTPPPSESPSGPPSKDACKHGGYVQYGFKNQGQCVASVVSH
jgi:putative nucleotidyltransferase with HDIG domain